MGLTQAEIDRAIAYPDEFSCQGVTGFLLFGIIISTLAVALRLWSRRLRKMSLAADDYTIIVALVLIVGSNICFLLMIYRWAWGRHMYIMTPEQEIKAFKANYAFNILYTTGYPLSKISLTLFYRRLFVRPWFNWTCIFLIFCFASYAISTAIIDIVSNIPIASYWDHSITPTRTIEGPKLFMANAAFNIVTDLILLILPLTVLWTLKMPARQKLGVSIIFALGTLTCVASIMRLVLYRNITGNDFPFIYGPTIWWTSAEVFLGVVCACLPTFRPLFSQGRTGVSSLFGAYGSSRFGSFGKGSSGNSRGGSSGQATRKSHSDSEVAHDDDEKSTVEHDQPLPAMSQSRTHLGHGNVIGQQQRNGSKSAVGVPVGIPGGANEARQPRHDPRVGNISSPYHDGRVGTSADAYFEKRDNGSVTPSDMENALPENAINVKTTMRLENY